MTLFDDQPPAGGPLLDLDGPQVIVEPVTIVHVPDHSYKKGPKGARGCKAPGCNRAKPHPAHNLPTVNETMVNDWAVYQGAKKHWQPYLVGLIEESGLPKGLESVLVEGLCVFPTRGVRDQDNHRGFIQKVLGDALSTAYCSACRAAWDDTAGACSSKKCEEGHRVDAWLPSDSWFPVSRYEFANLQARHEAGERRTELLLMPNVLVVEG